MSLDRLKFPIREHDSCDPDLFWKRSGGDPPHLDRASWFLTSGPVQRVVMLIQGGCSSSRFSSGIMCA
jgi:hypothetical protein